MPLTLRPRRAAPWRAPLIAALAISLSTSACKKDRGIDALPALADDVVLQRLADRTLPDHARARFSIKLRSKPLGIAAPPLGGGLVVSRPDQAYLTVLNPVGGPILTLATDGTRMVFLNNRDKQAFVEEDASTTLGGATAGNVGVDDLVDVLVGLVPVTPDEHVRTRRDGALSRMLFRRQDGATITTWVDPGLGTPTRVEVDDAKGTRMVEAEYGPFEEGETGPGLPTRVTVFVPSVELTIDLRYKAWTPLEAAPDVFRPPVPDDFTTLPMTAFADGISAVGDTGSSEAETP